MEPGLSNGMQEGPTQRMLSNVSNQILTFLILKRRGGAGASQLTKSPVHLRAVTLTYSVLVNLTYKSLACGEEVPGGDRQPTQTHGNSMQDCLRGIVMCALTQSWGDPVGPVVWVSFSRRGRSMMIQSLHVVCWGPYQR